MILERIAELQLRIARAKKLPALQKALQAEGLVEEIGEILQELARKQQALEIELRQLRRSVVETKER